MKTALTDPAALAGFWLFKSMRAVLPAGLAVFFLMAGCGQEAPQLSFSERSTADSVYREELKLLRVKLDSFCIKNQESMTRAAVDSLYRVRLDEISRQLNRIKNEQ